MKFLIFLIFIIVSTSFLVLCKPRDNAEQQSAVKQSAAAQYCLHGSHNCANSQAVIDQGNAEEDARPWYGVQMRGANNICQYEIRECGGFGFQEPPSCVFKNGVAFIGSGAELQKFVCVMPDQ